MSAVKMAAAAVEVVQQPLLGGLIKEDAALDGFAADGTLAHSVPTQLTGAVAAHEDHVLQPVQTHRTHGLQEETEERHQLMSWCLF